MGEASEIETRLRASQEYNRAIIESAPLALVVFDPDLRITDVNEGAVQLTGVERTELIGGDLDQYFEIPEAAFGAVRRSFDRGTGSKLALSVRSRAGSRVPVAGRVSVFHDPEGGLRGLFATAPEWSRAPTA